MMTGLDTYKAVLAELKHENTTSMTPAEFRYHIYVAQIEYVNIRYWAFEQHQKPIDDLRVLHVETNGIDGVAPLANVGVVAPEQEVFMLPEDYMHLLAVRARVKYYGEPCFVDGTLSDYIACKFAQDNSINIKKHHYYTKPAPRYPRMYYRQFQNKLRFVCGASVVHDVIAAYLRKPVPISIDDNYVNVTSSELDDPQTLEIVQWCVSSYLEKIESMRTQTIF
jgi:hypothetical protein